MPEIPVHMDAIINYNQSVSRVMGIHTSPSGLESTCLVFVHGLGKYNIKYLILNSYFYKWLLTQNDYNICRSVLYKSGTI